MYGQMTAGSWIYIGTQGILQGTYETFARGRAPALRRHAGAATASLTAGLGGMGGAQPLAVTMNEGACLASRSTRRARERRLETRLPRRADRRPRRGARARDRWRARRRRPLSIGLVGNAADV